MGKSHTPQRLITIMALSITAIVVLTITLLYEVSLEQQRQRLVEMVSSRARLIEAIAHFNSIESQPLDTDLSHTVLDEIRHAQNKLRNLGANGEFILARRSAENIEFLLLQQPQTSDQQDPIPLSSPLAEPMRHALQGKTGTLIGRDYRGELVLAAYQPIEILGWGVVAKITMHEIRAPYIKAAILAALIAAVVIAIGSMAMIRLLAPLLRQLRDDSAYQRTLFTHSPIGLALCRMDGTLVDTNPAFDDIIGRPPEESRTLSYWDITPGKYAEEEAKQLQQLEQRGEYGPYEKEYIHKNGYLVPVRLSGKVIYRHGEKFIWSSAEDISDKVCAERRLRQAATIFESTDEGIVITDENNRIIMVNSAYSEITGYAEEEVLGRNPNILRSDKHDTRFYESLWRHLQERGRWRGEMWNRHKDGTLFPVWQQISVIREPDGKVNNYVSIFSDISELKAVEQQLAHLAHHDELTGLPNRLHFKAQIEKSLHSARRNGHQLALLFLDLDGFKLINDNYGHDIGDQLLIEIARRLKQCVREEDTVARMGGDEFIIILQQIRGQQDAALVADNVVAAITRPVQLAQHLITPTTSIGISIYPHDATTTIGLQKAADNAMYRAKEGGKNRYKFFAQRQ